MREEEEQELLPRPNKSHQNSFSQGVKLTVKSEGCGGSAVVIENGALTGPTGDQPGQR